MPERPVLGGTKDPGSLITVCGALASVSTREHIGKPPPGETLAGASRDDHPWGVISLPAKPVSAWLARAYLRHWLELANWPGEQLAAIEHAVAEAVTNAVEHAYPPGAQGVVRITMMIDILDGGQTRQARVVVRDRGRWHCNFGHAERLGQGIHRMTRLVDAATIHRGGYDNDHGTEVILLSVPVVISDANTSSLRQEQAAGAGLGIHPATCSCGVGQRT